MSFLLKSQFKNVAELVQLIKEVGKKLELLEFKDCQIKSNVSNVALAGNEKRNNCIDPGT